MRSPFARPSMTGDALAIGSLALVCSLCFFPFVFQSHTLYWGDIGIYFRPLFRYIGEQLQQGAFPLWNPLAACGESIAGNPQAWLFYPSIVLLPAMSPEIYLTWTVVLHVLFAGVGSYAYLRGIGLSRASAWLGAVTFMLSGAFVARGQFPNSVQAASYLPWLLWVTDRHWQRPRGASAMALAGLCALMLLAAHPQMAYMALALLAPYTIGMWWRTRSSDRPLARSGARWLVVSAVVTFSLAMSQALPAVEMFAHSNRERLTYYSANRFLLPPEQAFNAVLPTLFGNPYSDNYVGRGNFWETCCYAGMLPLVLAAFAWLRVPRYHRLAWQKQLFVAAGVLAFWLALGRYGLLYLAAYRFVPGIKSFHDPARWLFLMSFAVSVLAAIGLERWFEVRRYRPNVPYQATWQTMAFGIALAAIGGVWAILAHFAPEIPLQFAHAISSLRLRPDYPFPADEQRAAMFVGSSVGSLVMAAALLILCALWMWLSSRSKFIGWSVVACAFVAADLVVFSSRLLPSTQPSAYDIAHEIAVARYGNELAEGRSLAVESQAGWWRHISYVGYYDTSRHLLDLTNSLTPNVAFGLGFPQADAYEPVLPQRSHAVITATRNAIASYDLRAEGLLDNLAVGTLIHTSLEWTAVVETRATIPPRVYVARRVMPAPDMQVATNILSAGIVDLSRDAIVEGAELSEGGAGDAEIVRDSPHRVEASANLAQSSWIILRDAAAPGWKLMVDGRVAEWQCANVMFRGALIPTGAHTLVYSYRPSSVLLGLYSMCLGLGAIAFGWGWRLARGARAGNDRPLKKYGTGFGGTA